MTTLFLAAPDQDTRIYGLIVALILLPHINGWFDWLSYGLTRTLLRINLRNPSRLVRTATGALDFALACLIMLALSATLILCLEGLNAIGHAQGLSGPIAPVAEVLNELDDHGISGENFWVAVALFSTLLPTVVHLFIWIGGLVTVVFQPRLPARTLDAIRDLKYGDPELPEATRIEIATWLVRRSYMGYVGGVVALVLLGVLWQNLDFLAQWLLDWAKDVQVWAAALFV